MKKGFLGIYTGHNATAALIDNTGRVLECVSEERFNSIKNYTGYPAKSINYIKKAHPNLEITKVGLPFLYLNPIFLTNKNNNNGIISLNSLAWHLARVLLRVNRKLYNFLYKTYTQTYGKKIAELEILNISEKTGISKNSIKGYNHQNCHAYTAYYLSPYNTEDALVLTLDGEGDGLCATVNIVKNGIYKTIAVTQLGHSLGWIYMDLTRYLGMKPNEHEYKVMGLAPYAKQEHVNVIYEKIKDWIVVDGLEFRSKFDTHLAYSVMKKSLEGYRFDNIAGAFQKLVENKITEWVENCINKTGIRTVCCGGGVFMNVKANMSVSQLSSVKKLWVMPSCGDESTAIGAALAAYFEYCNENNIKQGVMPIKDVYLGPKYTNDEINTFLKNGGYYEKYKIKKIDNVENEIAKLLSQGHVVANMSGRMEWGARALGNRSILANPSKPDVIREINEYVKNRDFWMPFAGSIISERTKDYIVNPKNIVADYMIISFESTDLAIKELRSAMHPYDFTIRPQTVSKEMNPRYYKILKEFEKLTGIGGVLNTSFNLHGLPIVLGPKQAMHVFENSGIKYMCLENFIINK